MAFDLGSELYDALQALKAEKGYRSTSQMVLQALEAFDYSGIEGSGRAPKQISVRVPPELREQLQQIAKDAEVSVGYLVRMSLMHFLENHSGAPKNASTDKDQQDLSGEDSWDFVSA